MALWVVALPLGCAGDDEGGDSGSAMDTSGGADGSGSDGSSGGGATVDSQEVAQMVLMYESLDKVTDMPIASTHGLANTMNVWVSGNAVDGYMGLPAATTFEEGSLFVKEQFNADGSLNSLAAMFKGPADYAPDAGDWWFGLVNPDGSLGPNGQPGTCVDCHAMAEIDFAYGLAG